MKFSFLKTLFAIICALIVFILALGPLSAYSYAHHDRETQKACVSECSFTSGNFFFSDPLNRETIDTFSTFISTLPPNVTAALMSDWKVVVSSSVPQPLQKFIDAKISLLPYAKKKETFSVFGYSNWNARIIYIKDLPNHGEMLRNFVHELGHYFDYEFGTPSATDEFIRIYSLYKDDFSEMDSSALAGYAISSREEFFATVFKEYLLYPKHLKEEAPEAFDFLNAIYTEVVNNSNATRTLKYDVQSVFKICDELFFSES